MPTLLWYEKLLPAFPGCATAVRLYAHANVLTDVVLSDRPPLHWLQPEQTASTVQCVLLREAERVR
jgi:hypothetical protein